MVDRVTIIIAQLRGGGLTVTRRIVDNDMDGAHVVVDEIFGMKEAREWAGDCNIDEVIDNRNVRLIRDCGSSIDDRILVVRIDQFCTKEFLERTSPDFKRDAELLREIAR